MLMHLAMFDVYNSDSGAKNVFKAIIKATMGGGNNIA